MTYLALAVAIPWIAAIPVAMLDGRRRPVGWFAVATLIATLIVLLLSVSRFTTGRGTQRMVTGGWDVGVGISLRADMLGVTFAATALVSDFGSRFRGLVRSSVKFFRLFSSWPLV